MAFQQDYPTSYYADDSPPPSPSPGSFFDHDLPPKKRPTFQVALNLSSWLSHRSQSSYSSSNNNNHNGPTAAPQPVRISEPTIANPFDVFAPNHRFKDAVNRVSGAGSQVARPSYDTLANSMVFDNLSEEAEARLSFGSGYSVGLPDSPTLPAFPPAARSFSPSKSPRPTKTSTQANTPLGPQAPLPDVFDIPSTHSSLKSASTSSLVSPSHHPMELPPLPSFRPISGFNPASSTSLAISQPPPPFTPVLLTPCSNPRADPTQIIIQLETASMSLCSTMHTLTAVPSRLSEYLTSSMSTMASGSRPASASGSPFSSAFQAHQEAMGLRPSAPSPSTTQSNTRMHIFLDRPSSPYIHILAFLRSVTAGARPSLPRGLLQMPASSAVRMEALFELREEARYLGMITLERLVDEEILLRQVQREVRHAGAGVAQSSHGSMSNNSNGNSKTLTRDVVERSSTAETTPVTSPSPAGPLKSLPPTMPLNLDRAKSPPPTVTAQPALLSSSALRNNSSNNKRPMSPPRILPPTSTITTTTRPNLTSSSTSNLPRLGDMDFAPPSSTFSALATRRRARSVTRSPRPSAPSGRI